MDDGVQLTTSLATGIESSHGKLKSLEIGLILHCSDTDMLSACAKYRFQKNSTGPKFDGTSLRTMQHCAVKHR